MHLWTYSMTTKLSTIMKKIAGILPLIVLLFFSAEAQRISLGKPIKDPNNWGVRVQIIGQSTYMDYDVDGTVISLPTTADIQVMGPWALHQTNGSLHLTASGNLPVGDYRLAKTDDLFYAIAYSKPNYNGKVIYLSKDQNYPQLFSGQGGKSIKTNVKAKYRDVNDGGTSGSWPHFQCVGKYPNIAPAARDIWVEMKKCGTGLQRIR